MILSLDQDSEHEKAGRGFPQFTSPNVPLTNTHIVLHIFCCKPSQQESAIVSKKYTFSTKRDWHIQDMTFFSIMDNFVH